MPIYKVVIVNSTTKVFIWKILETFKKLSDGITLNPKNQIRLNGMKSQIHKKGFLSVRHLLKEMGYKDADLIYDEFGKPHLKDGKHISITHSFIFSGIIISDNPVGIDIEKQRDKIVKIASKFTSVKEYKTVANYDALVRKLTIVWGAKESLYKIYGKKKILFLNHIYIDDFSFSDAKITGQINYNNEKKHLYNLHFLEFEDFTCVYAH